VIAIRKRDQALIFPYRSPGRINGLRAFRLRCWGIIAWTGDLHSQGEGPRQGAGHHRFGAGGARRRFAT